MSAYVAQELEAAHENTLGVDNLVDCFLALPLRLAHAIHHLLRNGIDPQPTRSLPHTKNKTRKQRHRMNSTRSTKAYHETIIHQILA